MLVLKEVKKQPRISEEKSLDLKVGVLYNADEKTGLIKSVFITVVGEASLIYPVMTICALWMCLFRTAAC